MKLLILSFMMIFVGQLFGQPGNSTPDFSIDFQKKNTQVVVGADGSLNLNIHPRKLKKILSSGYVSYSDFGAIGDGKADDIVAIAATHAFANLQKLPVRADDSDTYYISGRKLPVIIKTDTDFRDATFLIDDTEVEDLKAPVFQVASAHEHFSLEGISRLQKNQPTLGVALSGPNLVTVKNDQVKRYKRYGPNRNDGHDQTDIFLVNSDGGIDLKTPIIWDFDHISEIKGIPIDTIPLKISGGQFITIANQAESKYTYYSRNIEIRRSNVTVDGLLHRIQGEGDHGAPYRGFISVSYCADVTIQNTYLSGHKTYRTIGNAGKPVSMGSYDINLNHAVNVTFENCRQFNDINDRTYWGIIGSNFCKNIKLDKCSFSRFDAHMGVTNATILNSSIGYMGIRAIGHGDFVIENTTVRAKHFLYFRQDYGSTWQGDFFIKDCVFIPTARNAKYVALIHGMNTGQHDFGYQCSLPDQLIFENLKLQDTIQSDDYKGPVVFVDFNPELKSLEYRQQYPYELPEKVILKHVDVASGKPLRISQNEFMFRVVDMVVID